jgi:hypothetical protein
MKLWPLALGHFTALPIDQLKLNSFPFPVPSTMAVEQEIGDMEANVFE